MTPELSIAVRAAHRGRGVGTTLLRELIDDIGRMCLSVDVRSPAMRLYARLGFAEVCRKGFTATMLRAG
ncbi:MAG: GNAT family N-acetyltransferase [Acidimicrobiales bacterium]|nr:GNAT family N-acetyltransferase [Acidimicrobiales bacterium]